MSDVNVLYAVTAVVVACLLAWAGWVRMTAEDSPDESKGPSGGGDKDAKSGKRSREGFDEPTTITRRLAPLDETPPPATVEVSVRSERAVAIAGKSAPVVVLPVMRSRLDSHSEISDSPADAPAKDAETASAAEPSDAASRESVMPPGPPLSLVSAIGRGDASAGPTEMSAIIDRHHLFVLADGAGQRVQNELVSAVLVDSLAKAFDAGADAPPSTSGLPRRADRLRRSVVAAFGVLRSRGEDGPLDMSRVGVLAAHFSPDNRRLFISTVGPDRAYRLRSQEVSHVNKQGLSRPSGSGTDDPHVDTVALDAVPDDVYVFGSDRAFLALGDELRAVLTFDPSIDRVAAHFVAAASREGKNTAMTAIVVRVNPPRASMRPPAA
jgi:serine/threonine protein phosphatase PrpC